MNSEDNRTEHAAALAEPTDSLRADTPEHDSGQSRQALRIEADLIMRDRAALTMENLEALSPAETLRMIREMQARQI